LHDAASGLHVPHPDAAPHAVLPQQLMLPQSFAVHGQHSSLPGNVPL
jgi:hypothetical protein